MMMTNELIGKYKIVKSISKRLTSQILLAEKDGNYFVLKRLNKPINLNAFRQEILVLNRLNDLNPIIKFYGCKIIDKQFYLIFDYAKNGDLEEYIYQYGTFNEDQIIDFLEKTINRFKQYKNIKLLHNDIKPSNFILKDDDFYLIDWGISKFGDTIETIYREGNPNYVAPEMYEGERTFKSMIYSLGCCLYFIATGIAPFNARPEMSHDTKFYLHYEYMPDLSLIDSKLIAYVIYRMLDKNPKTRITIRELKYILTTKEYPKDKKYQAPIIKHDISDTYSLLHHLASKNIPHAQFRLGVNYEEDNSYHKARQWYYLAIKNNSWPMAECNLGILLQKGVGGDKDYSLAYNYLFLASLKNIAKAQYYLALQLEKGLGVTKNLALSTHWYKQSAINGEIKAVRKVKELNIPLIYEDYIL